MRHANRNAAHSDSVGVRLVTTFSPAAANVLCVPRLARLDDLISLLNEHRPENRTDVAMARRVAGSLEIGHDHPHVRLRRKNRPRSVLDGGRDHSPR